MFVYNMSIEHAPVLHKTYVNIQLITVYAVLYLLGIAMTGVLIGNSNIVSGNLLTDYSYVYETINSLLARCVTGLGPTGSNDNTALGTWYFNGAPLPYGLCEEPIVHLVQSRAASLMNFIGVINLWQCGPFTTTAEGVYTCVMMNSSMMNQTMRLGVYFSGRSEPSHYFLSHVIVILVAML